MLVIAAASGLTLAACSDEPWTPGGSAPGGKRSTPGAGGQSSSGTSTGGQSSGTPDKPPAGGAEGAINLPPQLTGFKVESAVVEVGGTTSLEIGVVDPENDPFHVWWRASCGAVAQDSEAQGKAIFIAPMKPGECRVTAVIQDAEMRTTAEQVSRIQVTPAADSEADDV